MEYMRAGLCCVASDLSGVRALFGEEAAGIAAGSDSDLARELTELLTTPGRIDTLGQRARLRFESHYSVDAMVAATDEVYAAAVRANDSGDGRT
jgi:glycosyltransferase involved in cell wall biosynthesis